jgi:hypothetical protein
MHTRTQAHTHTHTHIHTHAHTLDLTAYQAVSSSALPEHNVHIPMCAHSYKLQAHRQGKVPKLSDKEMVRYELLRHA